MQCVNSSINVSHRHKDKVLYYFLLGSSLLKHLTKEATWLADDCFVSHVLDSKRHNMTRIVSHRISVETKHASE